MRALRSALSIVGCALAIGLLSAAYAEPFKPSPGGGGGPGGGGPGGGDTPQGDQFQFKVCNQSKIQLSVAMLYKVENNAWRTVGWINYKPQECAPVRGTFPKNDFYWYAENGPGTITYSGKDAYGCVHPTNRFDRTISGEYQCAEGEKVVGFTKIDETNIRDGITLTD